jgi:thymidylate kinase
MDPPRLICIVGPDGTGKTTQAKLLIEKLRERGRYKYEYRWMRFHHLISLPVLALARLMKLTEIQTLPDGKKIGYPHFYRSKVISILYPITLYMDTILAMIFKIYIPLKIQRKRIVCDRFVYDTLVDLAIDLDDSSFIDSKMAKKFLKLIPEDCQTVLLIAPYEKIKKRREDLKFDKSLERRIKMYEKLSKMFPQIKRIDASLNIKSVHKGILNIVLGGKYEPPL